MDTLGFGANFAAPIQDTEMGKLLMAVRLGMLTAALILMIGLPVTQAQPESSKIDLPQQAVRNQERISALSDRIDKLEQVKAPERIATLEQEAKNTSTLLWAILSGIFALVAEAVIRMFRSSALGRRTAEKG